jgi:hypothetical protein
MLLEACRANENYTVSDNKVTILTIMSSISYGKERAEIDRGKRYERGSFSEGSGNNNRVRVDTRVGGRGERPQKRHLIRCPSLVGTTAKVPAD